MVDGTIHGCRKLLFKQVFFEKKLVKSQTVCQNSQTVGQKVEKVVNKVKKLVKKVKKLVKKFQKLSNNSKSRSLFRGAVYGSVTR